MVSDCQTAPGTGMRLRTASGTVCRSRARQL